MTRYKRHGLGVMVLMGVFTVPAMASTASLPAATGLSSWLGGSKQRFLPVTQAFDVQVSQHEDQLQVRFKIAPEHYIYQDKLRLTLPDGVVASAWQFSGAPSMIDDPQFGHVAVFEHAVDAHLRLSRDNAGYGKPVMATVSWQGCAKAGLCYPPERVSVEIAPDVLPITTEVQQTPDVMMTGVDDKTVTTGDGATTKASNVVVMDDVAKIDKHAQQGVLNHSLANGGIDDPFGLASRPLLAVFLLFLAGLVLAFTACIYPMIPIIANIVARDKSPSARRGFILTSAYALGVATSYGILGAAVAWFGRSLGVIGWLQNPWLLTLFALFFTGLAMQMFGFIQLRLPMVVHNALGRASHAADGKLGSVGGSFLVGLLSALVVSPCVSAPLGGALATMSVVGSVWLGFFALFALGFGLSLPLVVVGAAQGRFMPKAGQWMDKVRVFAGFMLLLVALLLIARLVVMPVILLVFALWFVLFGLWLYRLLILPLQAVGVLALMYAGLLLLGFATGANDPWRPLDSLALSTQAVHSQDIRVYSLGELDALLANHPKVLVDVTADWCIECRIMERTLFAQRPNTMHSWQLVKLDISKTDDASRAVLARYGLFGPPALLYYQDGTLKARQLGEVKRSDFEKVLVALN